MTFDIGDIAVVTAEFKLNGTTRVDPSTVVLKSKAPDSSVTTYTYGVDAALVRDELGVFHIDINLTAAGTWTFRWESTGTGKAAEEYAIRVRTSAF
jgi:hypothetical protein